MTTPAPLVLGLDIGGTSTRALVADTSGNRHGTGRGAGANLTSHALDDALAAISTAIRAALAGVADPARVSSALIGTAGPDNFKRPEVAAGFERVWNDLGLTCPYEITCDASVAFIAGTAEPDGTILLCGTGALAARIEGRQRVHTVDAHGWLLGDLGSGFWLGREAVRVVLDALNQLEIPGPLGQATLRAVLAPVGESGGSADDTPPEPWATAETLRTPTEFRALSDALVMRVHSRAPIALAELAPLVSEHVDQDPQAARILGQAADHLFKAVSTVRNDDGAPLVLAGSLLTSATPLRKLLEPRLAERWPTAAITEAHDGAAGAAWLAAAKLLGPDTEASAELHAHLVPTSS